MRGRGTTRLHATHAGGGRVPLLPSGPRPGYSFVAKRFAEFSLRLVSDGFANPGQAAALDHSAADHDGASRPGMALRHVPSAISIDDHGELRWWQRTGDHSFRAHS